MKYESTAQALEQLEKLNKTYMAYVHAMGVVELDAATAAPSGSWEGRGVTAGILSEVMYNLVADRDNGDLIAYLKEHAGELDAVLGQTGSMGMAMTKPITSAKACPPIREITSS